MLCQRCFKEVLRVFKESVMCVLRKYHKKFQGCFKNVSMKFCFAILLLHGSQHSYLSRRRACFVTNKYQVCAVSLGFDCTFDISSLSKLTNSQLLFVVILTLVFPVHCVENQDLLIEFKGSLRNCQNPNSTTTQLNLT